MNCIESVEYLFQFIKKGKQKELINEAKAVMTNLQSKIPKEILCIHSQ